MYAQRSGPVVVPIHRTSQGGGINCCCFCRCCTCINLNIVRTEPGFIKLAEVVSIFSCVRFFAILIYNSF